MAATFIGADTDPNSGDSQASSRSAVKPAGAQIAVFFINIWIGDGDTTITPASGVTLRNNQVQSEVRTATYVKYVDGDSTGTTYTFSFSGSKWSALHALFFDGVDTGLTLSSVPFNSATANGTAYASTTVTTVTDAVLAWNGNAGEGSGLTHTPPTNFTEASDLGWSTSAYRISPGDGSQTASGGAASSAVTDKVSSLLALAPAAGGTTVNGTGLGAFTFGSTAAGVPRTPGSGAAALSFTATASGTPEVFGAASGAYSFTGAASGSSQATVTGTGLGACSFTATATGTPETFGTAQATLSFTAAATGNPDVQGQAAVALTFTGTASGIVEGVATGTGQAALTFTAQATGTRDVHGQAAAALTLDTTAAGVRVRLGQAVTSITFDGAAVGAPVLSGQAVTALVFTGAALGTGSGDTIPDPNPLHFVYQAPSGHFAYQASSSHFVYQVPQSQFDYRQG